MTRIIPYYAFCCLFFISSNVSAALIVATEDEGDWSKKSSWNLNRIPENGDHVLIPGGITITVTSNNYNSTPSRPILDIEVRGTLLFIGGSGQLNLECSSTVNTIGGGIIPSTGCNCNQIAIGQGEAIWKGSYPSITNESGITGNCNDNLPVDLLSFTAEAEKNEVLLNWSTAAEINFSHFEVERSSDAIHFNTLATLSSNGNSYSYKDQHPLNGNCYYRLKEVDIDGSFQYSAIISVNYESSIQLSAFPNPSAHEGVNLILSEGESVGNTVFAMKDIVGSQIEINVQPNGEGSYLLEYPSTLPAGIYILTVAQSKGQYSKTIVVQ